MADGPAGFTPDACVLCYSGYCSRMLCFRLRVFHPLWLYLPVLSSNFASRFTQSHNPTRNYFLGFGLFHFRSPLLTESLSCFLFLRVLRCFNSPRSPHCQYLFLTRYPSQGGFSHSDITGSKLSWQLADAFRSLTRPSSLLDT